MKLSTQLTHSTTCAARDIENTRADVNRFAMIQAPKRRINAPYDPSTKQVVKATDRLAASSSRRDQTQPSRPPETLSGPERQRRLTAGPASPRPTGRETSCTHRVGRRPPQSARKKASPRSEPKE